MRGRRTSSGPGPGRTCGEDRAVVTTEASPERTEGQQREPDGGGGSLPRPKNRNFPKLSGCGKGDKKDASRRKSDVEQESHKSWDEPG